jgi:hypothetical protein
LRGLALGLLVTGLYYAIMMFAYRPLMFLMVHRGI